MIDQEIIHNQCLSDDPEERVKALEQLRDNFLLLPDKQKSWNDLYKLLYDKNSSVRSRAISTLGSVVFQVPDKQQTSDYLHGLITREDTQVTYGKIHELSSMSSQVPKKQLTSADLFILNLTNLDEIHDQCLSEHSDKRRAALTYLTDCFLFFPDKKQAWNDLIKLANDEDSSISFFAVNDLALAFPYVLDKQQAWNDLFKLFTEINSHNNFFLAKTLISTFPDVPDKQQVWDDLITLVSFGKFPEISISHNLISVIFYVPDKQKVWSDLINLINNEFVGMKTFHTLHFAFLTVTEKQKAWDDLIRLANEDNFINFRLLEVIKFAYPNVPDKKIAWDDLIKLAHKDNYTKFRTFEITDFVFPYMPDKQRACNDLIKFTKYNDFYTRSRAVYSLGSLYSHVPDKRLVWNYLIELGDDKESRVRAYAYHSLGRISIFKASQAETEEDYKEELEKAILFFEKSLSEYPDEVDNPSKFCLPFYRSFYLIIFKMQEEAKEEVKRYLLEAKNARLGSKSKEMLLEIVENLEDALKEVQNLKNLDLETMKGDLSTYRTYCDRAVGIMINTEETTPYATKVLRKGLPIFNEKLKSLLEEIQEKAKTACQVSQGTPTQEIACAVSKEVQKWGISSQEEMTQNIESLIEIFRLKMPHLSGYEHIFKEIEGIRDEKDLVKQYIIISKLVGLIPIFSSMPDHVIQDIKDIKEKTNLFSNEVQNLQISVDSLIESVDKLQNPQEYLDTIQRNLEEIKNDMPGMKEQIEEVLYELYSPLSTTQKLKVAIPIIPLLASYEIETDVPRLVADKICELKNLILRFKNN